MHGQRQPWRALHLALAALAALPGGAVALPAQPAPAAPRAQDDARISLQLQGAEIRDALRMVAQQAGVDLVVSNQVTGTVSLELNEATLDAALDAIVHVGGFEYARRDGIVTVSTLGELLERERQRRELDQQRAEHAGGPVAPEAIVFDLRYVDAERVQPIVEPLLSEGGSATILMTADHVAQDQGRAGREPARSTSSESEFQIGAQLSTTSQGQPARSHTLVVVDVPERLAKVRDVIERIDVKPAGILIEARFVEILLDDDQRLGIDWNVVASAAGAAAPHTFPFLSDSLGASDANVIGGVDGSTFPQAPNSVTVPGEPGLYTFGTLDFSAFTAVLRMIRSNSRVQIVSNPRVVVDDRHTATILVGERYPILSANISEFGTVTEQLDRYEPIGVQLEVTPSLLSDGEVELIVRPSTSSLGPEVSGSTGLTVSRINARQIDTSVTVENSETIVLGGLITSREAEEEHRVPYISRVPLLGSLFRHTAKSDERVELVVFLTVTVLERDGLSERERELFETSSPEPSSPEPASAPVGAAHAVEAGPVLEPVEAPRRLRFFGPTPRF